MKTFWTIMRQTYARSSWAYRIGFTLNWLGTLIILSSVIIGHPVPFDYVIGYLAVVLVFAATFMIENHFYLKKLEREMQQERERWLVLHEEAKKYGVDPPPD